MKVWRCMILLLLVMPVVAAWGGEVLRGETSGTSAAQPLNLGNPIAVVQDAVNALPGVKGGFPATVNLLILLTVLSLAPAVLILCTSFVRIVVVLALLRQAIGTPTLPPTQVLTGLALFMT